MAVFLVTVCDDATRSLDKLEIGGRKIGWHV